MVKCVLCDHEGCSKITMQLNGVEGTLEFWLCKDHLVAEVRKAADKMPLASTVLADVIGQK